MNLTEILNNIIPSFNIDNIFINKVEIDSRNISTEDLFVALNGTNSDGRNYIKQAIDNGAAAVISDKLEFTEGFNFLEKDIYEYQSTPIFSIYGLRAILGDIIKNFYSSETVRKIAVTGTNGKTSVTNFISQLLNLNEIKSATIGTMGYGVPNNLQDTGLTTPDCVSVYKILSEFSKQNVKVATLEASSHAISQDRISGLKFSSLIFTNLTQDHLDYHNSMEEYWQAKQKLFFAYNFDNAIINIDNLYGVDLYAKLKQHFSNTNVITYSLINTQADVFVTSYKADLSGTKAFVNTPWGNGNINLNLLGDFNLSNALAAIIAACLEGIDITNALDSANKLLPVNGRMMCFGGGNLPLVVIDYSHTPDALDKALTCLKNIAEKNITTVFGCGGDRDRTKRAPMLAAAMKYSNKTIITADNPRNEDQKQIFNDILSGNNLASFKNVFIESDRATAINKSILESSKGDIIFLAGKGHEDYQIIGSQKIYFSDIEEAKKALLKHKEKIND